MSAQSNDALTTAQKIAARAMNAYGQKLKVVATNLANAHSTASQPGELPYARQVITFGHKYDRKLGAEVVNVKNIALDRTPFEKVYAPGHPAADENGMIDKPNVNPLYEITDMRNTSQDYDRILKSVKMATSLQHKTIDLMR